MLPVFTELLHSGHAEECLLHDLEAVAGLRDSRRTRRGLLFDDDHGRLVITDALSRTPSTLEGNARHLIVGSLCGHVTLTRHRHTTQQDPAVFDPQCRLEALPDLELQGGATFAAEAWWDVVEPYGEGLLLVLESAPVYSTAWSYNRDSKCPEALIAGGRNLARMQAALDLLAQIGTPEDAHICVRLAAHPSHAIRWEAIRTAYALDHPDAMRLLKAATQDSHPHIREAASEALRQWS